MCWQRMSNHHRRFLEFSHQGTQVYVSIRVYSPRQYQEFNRVEVRWKCAKFRGSLFNFEFKYHMGEWFPRKDLFKRLRTSLAYGLNPLAREVTDKMLSAVGEYAGPPHKQSQISGKYVGKS